jgi:predicted permease
MGIAPAIRRLLRAPAFTITILAVFALGIAGNTAVLSLLDSLVLHPNGIQSPERLVFPRVRYGRLNIQSMSMSGPDFADVRDGREHFASSAAILITSFTYRDSLTAIRLEAARVTWQFFDVMGIPPALGRTFREDDDTKRQRVVVLSDAIWRSQFGSDARVLGRGVYLDDERYEVVGVMPADFAFPRRATFWVPMGRTYAEFRHSRRYDEDLLVVARLRPGVTSSQADAWLRALSQLLLQGDQKEAQIEEWSMFAVPFLEFNNKGLRIQLMILAGALLFVLLIACSNIAGLMLARASRMSGEYAMRMAMGARPADILRLWLWESLVLSVVGGLMGLLLGWWAVHLFLAQELAEFAKGLTVRLNPLVVAFLLGVVTLAGGVFGAIPAMQAIRSTNLRTNSLGGTRVSDRQRFRQGLIALQIALTLTLLVGSGLLLRSLANLRSVNPGFEARGLITAQLMLSPVRYDNPEKLRAFYLAALDRLKALPGVQAVAATVALPFAQGPFTASFAIVGHPGSPGQPWPYGGYNLVTEEFPRAMRMRLLRGRFFAASDRAGSEAVCVVDDLLVKKYWAGRYPVGEMIERDGHRTRVIGVVNHVQQRLDDPTEDGSYYEPLLQVPVSNVSFVVRTQRDVALSVGAIRRTFHLLDPTQPVFHVSSMDDWAEQSLATRMLVVRLLESFAAFALLLACVGIYGIISYWAVQRTFEVGIRMALGAGRREILRLFVGKGLQLAAMGAIGGLVLSAPLGVVFERELYGVSPFDVGTYCAMTGFLVIASLGASFVPAWRAARLEPHEALREGRG